MKPNKAKETTSKRVARIASELLSNPKTPAKVKSVAAFAMHRPGAARSRLFG